jgi:hypothetical protein
MREPFLKNYYEFPDGVLKMDPTAGEGRGGRERRGGEGREGREWLLQKNSFCQAVPIGNCHGRDSFGF